LDRQAGVQQHTTLRSRSLTAAQKEFTSLVAELVSLAQVAPDDVVLEALPKMRQWQQQV
jgi:hypothetical protein